MLRLVGVSKRYRDATALAPTDLDVGRGRTTVLIGPSGCGKTTLLRLMIGLIHPDAGQVLFDGAAITPENVRGLRTRMGYVVQDGGLFPHLNARDNVCLLARHLGWSPARADARVAELAELVRLPADLLAHHPGEMSGGQRQRVGLMRALMLEPELLLLDEPLGALDPLVRAELQDDLAAIFQKVGKSVVLVTHDLAEAAFFGHLIVLLQAGRVVQRGSIEDLVRRPVEPFVTKFVQAQRTFDDGRAP
ncbi:MAG TPA: ATP-binding cassette domain-containing protein [Polyangia bacterium]